MKKFILAVLLCMTVLMAMPAALAEESAPMTVSYCDAMDLSDLATVSLMKEEDWDEDWTCYKDQLTGDALEIYEMCETGFAEDSVPLVTLMYSDGSTGKCWWLGTVLTKEFQDDEKEEFNRAKGEMKSVAVQAFTAFTYDHPEYFWIRESISCGVTEGSQPGKMWLSIGAGFGAVASCDTVEKRDELKEKFDTVVESILAETEGLPVVEQLAYFDNWLAANNSYNQTAAGTENYIETDSMPFCSAGALLDGYSPVCEGYAKAFQVLCHKIGVPCLEVTGWAGEGHMWTVVQLNGKWYFCDPTWNDPVYNGSESRDYSCRNYFLTSQPDSHRAKDGVLIVPRVSKRDYFDDWDSEKDGVFGGELGSGQMLIVLYDEDCRMIACKTCSYFTWNEAEGTVMFVSPVFSEEEMEKAASVIRINLDSDTWCPLNAVRTIA